MRKLVPILAAWATLASAQQLPVDDADNAAAVPFYTVEVIVFSYAENVWVGSEIFVPDALPEEFRVDDEGNPVYPGDSVPEYGDTIGSGARGVSPEEDAETWKVVSHLDRPATTGGSRSGPRELVLLPEDELQLGRIIDRFRRLDVYDTLMHFGWTQPAYPEEETPPIDLQLFGSPPPGLDGTLTLYLSRYLHLVVDVALDAPPQFEQEVVDDESFYSFGDDRPQYDDEYSRRTLPVRFRIVEDRILKSGELRYFDHPKFGVLAIVTRIEEADDAESVASLRR